jgi:hypothetical protein
MTMVPRRQQARPDHGRRSWWLMAAALGALLPTASGAAETEVAAGGLRFRVHPIATFPGGYQVIVADMNGDRRPDVVGLATRPPTLAWFQNPTWTRHAVAAPGQGFIDAAALDLDGDGRLDLALASDFELRRPDSGQLQFLTRGPAGEEWRARSIAPEPTIHRVRWADVEGDGTPELVAVPIIGPGAAEPEFAVPARLVLFRLPDWKPTVIDQQSHVVHGVRIVDWDGAGGQEILTASFEGVHLFRWRAPERAWEKVRLASGDQRSGPRRGASEVAMGRLGQGRRFLATVEPWHGHQVVVYAPPAGPGQPRRRVIDDSLVDAHALEVADLDGDGRDEIVAGFRGKGRRLLLYRARDGDGDSDGAVWERSVLDDGGMATSGVRVVDLDQDGRLDIVAIGSASGNLKWYQNRKP